MPLKESVLKMKTFNSWKIKCWLEIMALKAYKMQFTLRAPIAQRCAIMRTIINIVLERATACCGNFQSKIKEEKHVSCQSDAVSLLFISTTAVEVVVAFDVNGISFLKWKARAMPRRYCLQKV
jgi:hypothetical protein